MTTPSTSSRQTQETADKLPAALQAQDALPAPVPQADVLPVQPRLQSQAAQVDLLGNQEIPSAQRQRIATRIGRTRGNRYLQRIIHRVVQRDLEGTQTETTEGSSDQSSSQTERELPPELQNSVDPKGLTEGELLERLILIEQTLKTLDPSSAQAQHLQKEAANIEQAMVERKIEAQITKELEAFLANFSNIKVTVRWKEGEGEAQVEQSEEVGFHPPYFMNVNKETRSSEYSRTEERFDTAKANRAAADRATRKLLREIYKSKQEGGMAIGRARVGKSYPEDLRQIVQTALDRDLIKAGEGRDHPNGEDMRAWLIKYGIGVDCSGFVSQALNQVVANVRGKPLSKKETLKKGGRGLKGGARRFKEIKDPTQLKAGDTVAIPGHIRIILSVGRTADGEVQFVTGESRAGGKADVGPERVQWRYVNGKLQRKGSDSDEWVRSKEKPIFGRYTLLESARESAATAEMDPTKPIPIAP